MKKFSQEFKLQAVKKVLEKRADQTTKYIAETLNIGHSTLQKWVRLVKDNKLEKIQNKTTEKSPHKWEQEQRLNAIMHCHGLNEEHISEDCRKNGIYPHHLSAWKSEFISKKQTSDVVSKQEKSKLKQENKRLQKELNRKDKALAETAALLVLSKKCQAIWTEIQED
ncbi:MAG: transposase [Alteromonadaceae bacterium]|jgi:transposase